MKSLFRDLLIVQLNAIAISNRRLTKIDWKFVYSAWMPSWIGEICSEKIKFNEIFMNFLKCLEIFSLSAALNSLRHSTVSYFGNQLSKILQFQWLQSTVKTFNNFQFHSLDFQSDHKTWLVGRVSAKQFSKIEWNLISTMFYDTWIVVNSSIRSTIGLFVPQVLLIIIEQKANRIFAWKLTAWIVYRSLSEDVSLAFSLWICEYIIDGVARVF